MQQLIVIVEAIWGGSLAIALLTGLLAAVSLKLRTELIGPPTDRSYDER